jgi:Family of unknown function (DUF6535)
LTPKPSVLIFPMVGVLACRHIILTKDSVLIHALGDNYGDPSGKLWSMYLAEAEKEDKELTEAWKGEADSILVFVRFFLTLSTLVDN